MKELNFDLNVLYSQVLVNYYSLCTLTLDTENKVPPKYSNKIDKRLFKLMWKQLKQAKKVYRFNLKVKRRSLRREKIKFLFNKIKFLFKRK